MDDKNVIGNQPAKNHQLVQVPFIHQVNATAFDTYLMRHKGCHACPIQCSRQSRVADGPYRVSLEGPEAETASALGPMCWVNDPEAIIYANHLCNEYGLDTISTGVTVAFAMELHQRGLLQDDELLLEWGDQDSLIGLIEQITDRRGLGDLLAEGTRRAALVIGKGAEYYAMQVKGLEIPGQDPRFAKSFALGYVTSNRGADHLYALPVMDQNGNREAARKIFPEEILPELLDPASEKYKADLVVHGEHFCAVTDALGICKFSTVEEHSLVPADLAAGVSALMGREVTGPDLLQIGERIVNLERMYNVRHGLSRADDCLPPRFTDELLPLYRYEQDHSGRLQTVGEPISYGLVQDLNAMLDRYYSLRGWSSDGVPAGDTLRRLNLIDIVAER
jgi:aldehyde:ferredoxin oxidoreductase